MPLAPWSPKDPDEIDTFGVDFAQRLDSADELASAAWTAPSGLTIVSSALATSAKHPSRNVRATAVISGGVSGTNYEIALRVTTTAGRTLDETAILPVVNR